jgi:hypothetical protein
MDSSMVEGLAEDTVLIDVPWAFSRTLTELLPPFATTRSAVPLALKSPTTAE